MILMCQEDWLNFFFEGVTETANDARKTILSIRKVFNATDEKISKMGRSRISAATVMAEFKRKPLLTISEIESETKLSNKAVANTVDRLIELGILKKASERKWGQLFVYSDYAALLIPGTEIN